MTREEAIKVLVRISEDTIQRDCSTCGRPTAGIYSGVCCYCSLCEVVPEILKDYHERKHFRSYWTWDGKRKNEALDMAISALRQQGQERNAPLTLDELREAAQTGDPVWLVRANCSSWVVIEKVDDRKYIQLVDYAEFGSDEPYDFAISDYGDSFKAYRQKPEEGTV